MVERSSVQYGRTIIPFQVRRSAARSQVSLVVQAGQPGVLVYAPKDTPLDRLAAVVRQRGAWAVAKLRQVEQADRPDRPREFVSGEGFTYLGRSFRLGVHAVRDPVRPGWSAGGWRCEVPRGLGDAARRRAVRAAVIAWFKERAAARLPERLERFTKKLGLPDAAPPPPRPGAAGGGAATRRARSGSTGASCRRRWCSWTTWPRTRRSTWSTRTTPGPTGPNWRG